MLDPPDLEIRRSLPVTPTVAFLAFSESDQLARWWGPEGFTIPSLDFTPRVGRSYRIEMQPPDGPPFHLTGEFREVDPPARLVFTFAWEDPDPDDVETLVQLTFLARDGLTELTLVQGSFRTEARRSLHRDGWRDSFDKLERQLSS
jgi:uncharacterized protein YndB with AHSA1/START domain